MKRTLLFLVILLLCVSDAEASERKRKGKYASTHGSVNGHEYVDLGLPSGLKWATCNVGASKPEDYGYYYSWGEIEISSFMSYDIYNSRTYGKDMYDISGNSSYDAARANWGGTWRLPTKSEYQELIDNCTWTWTSQGGKNGYNVTGPNGNSIFFPATGICSGVFHSYYAEHCGQYWSSTPDENNNEDAAGIGFNEDSYFIGIGCRSGGQSVRPVTESLTAGAEAAERKRQETAVKLERKLQEEYASTHGSVNGHEYVDLGLPSGLKWATCNVGANKPEGFGDYFAWGETIPKNEYTEENSLTYGKQMGDISGNTQYDAATANWGDSWRIPTKAEFQELIDKCTWTWTSQNYTNGYNVKGPNGNHIFLPAALYRIEDVSDYFTRGYYWCSDPYDSNNAYYLYFFSSGSLFDSDEYNLYYYYRCYGYPVRPVSE